MNIPAESKALAAVINPYYLCDENEAMNELLPMCACPSSIYGKIHDTAYALINSVKARQKETPALQAFLNHYDLSSQEGIVLMCLAEALLRIPDSSTIDALIADKITSGNWKQHLGESESLFVNASTWALMLTGQTIRPARSAVNNPARYISRLFSRLEEPVVRTAMKSAMRIMAHQFVMGRTIDEALGRTGVKENSVYRYSFDMLGESAITTKDADRYHAAYTSAIRKIGHSINTSMDVVAQPSISVKLSALCPRYEYLHYERSVKELSQRLSELALLARDNGIALTIDAEESDRLNMSLLIFKNIYLLQELADWNGLGLAVQAYQKRALAVIKWLDDLSRHHKKIIPLRLVKGAYWDTEIKRAQEQGLQDYPVFTRKSNTDISYLACTRYLLDNCDFVYPQFATHNAHTLAYIYHNHNGRKFEFQRIHGMGEELYTEVIGENKLNIPCRVYAPVGAHEDLLPYLVRRLLENGANTSFVNQLGHADTRIEDIIADPIKITENLNNELRHPKIPLPGDLYGKSRKNSKGMNFSDELELESCTSEINSVLKKEWSVGPIINGKKPGGITQTVISPHDGKSIIGKVDFTQAEAIKDAINTTANSWAGWNSVPVKDRASILEKAADIFESRQSELLALCVREAGKTIRDSHNEIREAIDFLRYYASMARKKLSRPVKLPGPTGESNELSLQGRGIFFCISPWNFPVAIFTGQVAAALVAGNTVLAKPAEQTSIVACLVTSLLYEAGIPREVLQFLPGAGEQIGNIVLQDTRIAGVAFTGSTETANQINQVLASRKGPIATLIAETGGQNALIADSTALPEQLVLDIVESAVNSAGQRCSALRVLYLQEEIAPRVIELLTGYLDELKMGDPLCLETDIGPVIDMASKQALEEHIQQCGKLLYRYRHTQDTGNGYFVPPAVIEIDKISDLTKENFGPVLHIVRFDGAQLPQVIEDINNSGYALTLGIHSRIEKRAEEIRNNVRAGNIYVNRNMVGAVVGVQPFGGSGLSGTGPKAGGPHYLNRFTTEQTYTVNTSAVGGNASLLTIS